MSARTFQPLLKKELQILLGERRLILALGDFALILVILSSFSYYAVGISDAVLAKLVPGVIWIAILFCAVIVLNFAAQAEKDYGALSVVAIASGRSIWIYAAKALAASAMLLLLSLMIIAFSALFFSYAIMSKPLELAVLITLGVVGLSALGSALALVSASSTGRDLLLPVLLFPLSLPLILGEVELTRDLIQNGVSPFGRFWFTVICVFDTVVVALGVVLFPFLLEE
jgi:heme exporter protein B